MLDDTTFHTAYTTVDRPQLRATEPSLEGLLRWSEGQDQDEAYCYADASECLMGQYLASLGYRKSTAFSYTRGDTVWSAHWPSPIHSVAIDEPRTFGAAAARCRSLLRSDSHV